MMAVEMINMVMIMMKMKNTPSRSGQEGTQIWDYYYQLNGYSPFHVGNSNTP